MIPRAFTILIVDDRSANRDVLAGLLRHHGYRLLEAVDGSEGLAAARAQHPDLIITDVLMPVMDGYEFVKQLRLDPTTSGIPVVFYTAHYGEREARALASSGRVFDVLTKPVEFGEVLRIVRRALSGEPVTMPSDGSPLTTAFDREHLRLLTDKLSAQSADLKTANARLRALINILLEFTSERDHDRRLQRVCASACDLFGATYATLGILNPVDRTVQRVVTCGTGAAGWIKNGDTLSGILGTVVDERRTLRGDPPDGDSATRQFPALHPDVQAYLAVPIASPAYVYGWICLVGNEGHAFDDDDEELVIALSGQVGRMFEHEHESLERQQAESALRNSERLNRTLVEHLPHRIVVKDRNSVVLFCNTNYAREVGLSPEDVIGRSALDFDPRPLATAYDLDDREVMVGGLTTDREERYEAGGQTRWTHSVKVPYRDEQGQVIGVLGVFEDITERRTLEARYQQAQKMEGIGRLAGGIAHDFNNLLTAIIGYTEMVLEQIGPDKPISQDLAEIRNASDRAVALTRKLLAFSRAQTLHMTSLDLNDVIASIRDMLRRIISEDIDIQLRLTPGLPAVLADRVQLEQVLMNLIVNARDAMPRGGMVTIETMTADDGEFPDVPDAVAPKHFVRLRVADTGSGMDAATRERIFDPFFTTKGIGEGTGLGLATVYGVVQQIGGHIAVASEVGHGTTFTLYLPEAPSGATMARPTASQRHGAPLAMHREVVLIVEDQRAVRQLVSRILSRHGYVVVEAEDGAEALAWFERGHSPPDVVISDVMMPTMNGPELVATLLARHPTLKVLFISGYSGDVLARRTDLEPTATVLEKPFTASMLLQAIREVLDDPGLPATGDPTPAARQSEGVQPVLAGEVADQTRGPAEARSHGE